MSRLSRESETRAAAWCRAVCAWAGGMAAALLLIMNVALLLPPESEAAVDKLTRQAGRVPLACYLRWSGNWAKPEDRPATLADYLNRWMAR